MEWDADCIQIANRAGSMCWLHEEAAKIYEKRDTIASTLVNVGTSLLGGVAITFLAASNPDKIYIILFQVATLGLGISGIVMNSFAWRSKATKHRVLVGKNDSIFSQIRKELRKPLPDRTESKHFHENVIDLESEVRQDSGSLSIPPQIYVKYKEMFGNVALSLPELVVIAIEREPLEPELRDRNPEAFGDQETSASRSPKGTGPSVPVPLVYTSPSNPGGTRDMEYELQRYTLNHHRPTTASRRLEGSVGDSQTAPTFGFI